MAAGMELLDDYTFECPVCLEMLDDTCKMLPCQHTFCKQCLEKIFMNHQRLECPQCRMLVNIDICQLPRNYFLLNVLEQVKSARTKNVIAQDVVNPEERKRIPVSEMKKLENELKLLKICYSDNSSVSSDFNEIKRIMNDFLHLGIDEKNGQFSKDVAQFANMIDVEEDGLNSDELKLYRSFIDYCLKILNKYHGKIYFLDRDPDDTQHVDMICTDGIENLDQVFKNINLNDEPIVDVEDEDVSEDILKESKLAFIVVRLVDIFNRFKEQIELRMALVMSQTNEAIAIE